MSAHTSETTSYLSTLDNLEERSIPRIYRSVTLYNLVQGIGAANDIDTLEELRQTTGYDYVNYYPIYPAETVLKVIEFFRDKHYHGWPAPEAYRALGRFAVAGWTTTTFGRVTLLMVPLLSPHDAARYLPTVFDRSRLFGHRKVEQTGPNSYTFHLADEVLPADYIAGQVEAAAALVGKIKDYRVITGPLINPDLVQITIRYEL